MLYRELNTVGGYLSSACGGGKIYAKNIKFCIAAVFVVCQGDNHIIFSLPTTGTALAVFVVLYKGKRRGAGSFSL